MYSEISYNVVSTVADIRGELKKYCIVSYKVTTLLLLSKSRNKLHKRRDNYKDNYLRTYVFKHSVLLVIVQSCLNVYKTVQANATSNS